MIEIITNLFGALCTVTVILVVVGVVVVFNHFLRTVVKNGTIGVGQTRKKMQTVWSVVNGLETGLNYATLFNGFGVVN